MKIHIPSDIASLLSKECYDEPLLKAVSGHDVQLDVRWSSFLHFLGLDHLFFQAPLIDANHMIFKATLDVLSAHKERSELEYVFDSLFAECLRIVKSLKEIDPAFLLQKIDERRSSLPVQLSAKIAPVLDHYSMLLKDKPYHTMHNLVLLLAWDRMCVLMKGLFDHQSSSKVFACGINVLKECLIESYIHISTQVGCKISLYRLVEALLYYFIREENINSHTDHEWKVFSHGVSILRDEDLFISNNFYIDDLFAQNELSDIYLSSELTEIVSNKISLAVCLLKKITEFSSFEIFTIKNVRSF